MIDYYEILEVNQKASPEIIGEVYKILQQRVELSNNLESIEKAQKLQELKIAFDVLSDTKKRKAYDFELYDAKGGFNELLQIHSVNKQTVGKTLKVKQKNFNLPSSAEKVADEMIDSSLILSRIKWNRWGWAVSILVVVIVLISMVRPDPEKALRGKMAVSLEAEKDRKELDAELHKYYAEKQSVDFTETKGKTESEAK